MNLTFSSGSWESYLYRQKTDKAMLKRINSLLKAIQREPF